MSDSRRSLMEKTLKIRLIPRRCGHLDRAPYPIWQADTNNECDGCTKRDPEWWNSVWGNTKLEGREENGK